MEKESRNYRYSQINNCLLKGVLTNAFNIQIMEKSERELFRFIKEKRVQEIILNPLPERGGKNLSYMMLENHDKLSIDNIKKVK